MVRSSVGDAKIRKRFAAEAIEKQTRRHERIVCIRFPQRGVRTSPNLVHVARGDAIVEIAQRFFVDEIVRNILKSSTRFGNNGLESAARSRRTRLPSSRVTCREAWVACSKPCCSRARRRSSRVENVRAGHSVFATAHQAELYHVLDFFDVQGSAMGSVGGRSG